MAENVVASAKKLSLGHELIVQQDNDPKHQNAHRNV